MGYEYPASVRGDLRLGRLHAALTRLGALKRPDLRARLAIADLLQQTGQSGEAVAALQREIARSQLEAAERAFSHFILGNAALSFGRRTEALTELREAVQSADAAGDAALACHARMRVFSILDALGQRDAAETLVVETRRLVLRAADPQLTAWLHARLGRREERRGALDGSTKHLLAARDLLSRSPNLVISGVVAVHLCAVALLRCRLDDALHEAETALVDAERSGHAWTLVTAIAHLGLTHLRLGRFEDARRFIARGLELSASVPQAQIALLDTTAQLGLAEGNDQAVADAFARIDALASSHTRRSQNLVRVSLTRARYLLRAGRAEDALRVAEGGMAEVTRSDRLLRARFLSLRAQALIACGRTDEASRTLITALTLLDAAPLGLLAELERTRSGLLHALSQPAAAELGFQRVLRILHAVGDEAALRGAKLEHTRASASVDEPPADPSAARARQHPLRTSGFELLTAAAHLLATAEQPELLGAEALALLEALGAARAARLVDRPGHPPARAPRVLQSIGEAHETAAWTDPHVVVAPLRRDEGGSLALEVIPRDTLEEHAAVVSLCRLLRAAMSLEATRHDARQRAPLWPVDKAPDEAGGIFIAPTMQDVLASVRRVAPTDLPVLLLGETGTGKEIIARELHRVSTRRMHPFVPFNCTAVSRDMLESQLFGYRRGAFTGAQEDFPGIIRGAEGGTLFLDEIGEMAPEIQPKLLRFLESGEIHPLGRTQPIEANVRVIAATNAALSDLVRGGRFRRDLYYRLNVCRIIIPPLRERPEEIPALVQHFAHRQCHELGKPIPPLADEVMEYLLLYGWPGNVRQLANEVRRLVALAAPEEAVTADMLAPEILEARVKGPSRVTGEHEVRLRLNQPLGRAIEQIERVMIAYALERSGGSFAGAARHLGITRRGLLMKRRRLGIMGDTYGRWLPPET